jgi:hypothetical protein
MCLSTSAPSRGPAPQSWSRDNTWSSKSSRARRDPRRNRCVLPRRAERSGERHPADKGRQRESSFSRREPRRNTDEEALALREENCSYAWVARSLGFKWVNDARQGFLRALAKREDAERDALLRRELERLDELEARIRRRDESKPDTLARRLAALDRLRQELLKQ